MSFLVDVVEKYRAGPSIFPKRTPMFGYPPRRSNPGLLEPRLDLDAGPNPFGWNPGLTFTGPDTP